MRKLARDEAEEYFALLPKTQAVVLTDLRDRITRLAKAEPDLIISYQLPTIRVAGKSFLAFAAWKDFYSIYLLSGSLGATIAQELSQGTLDKSTLRFSWDERVTDKTLRLLIRARREEIAQRGN